MNHTDSIFHCEMDIMAMKIIRPYQVSERLSGDATQRHSCPHACQKGAEKAVSRKVSVACLTSEPVRSGVKVASPTLHVLFIKACSFVVTELHFHSSVLLRSGGCHLAKTDQLVDRGENFCLVKISR